VDLVSQAMVAAMWSTATSEDKGSTPQFFHVSSSGSSNPMTVGMFAEGIRWGFVLCVVLRRMLAAIE